MRVCALANRWLRASPLRQALLTIILLNLIGTKASTSNCAACPRCPPPPANCVEHDQSTCDECLYKINNSNKSNLLLTTSAKYFELQCPDNVSLDDPSLPALENQSFTVQVHLKGCGVPKGSYKQALARLNVTEPEELHIKAESSTKLRNDHFEGLNSLRTLYIEAADINQPFEVESGVLKPLVLVKHLYLTGLLLPPESLHFPVSLRRLSLRECRLKELPTKVILGLYRLTQLIIIDESLEVPPNITAARRLKYFTISAPKINQVFLSSRLTELTIEAISSPQLEGNCSSLKKLTFRYAQTTSLPERWLERCNRIEVILLTLGNLTNVPYNVFHNVTALQEFTLFSSRNLTTLPESLFRYNRHLTDIKMTSNNLTFLPTSIFTSLPNLKSLTLSNNKLGPSALTSIVDLTGLTSLTLDNNPLGNLCKTSSSSVLSKVNSPLRKLLALENLSLKDTGATRICTDWKDTLTDLRNLDLSDNKIVALESSDMDWSPSGNIEVTVNLQGNPLVNIELPRQDAPASRPNRTMAHIFIDSALQCDCNMYWFAKALTRGWLSVRFTGLQCLAPPPINQFPFRNLLPENMKCNITENCPTNCTCEYRAHDRTTLVACQNRSSLPDTRNLHGTYLELNMTGNQLTALPDVLPVRLKSLDISNNNITELSIAAAAKLTSRSLIVWLAGNPFACRCTDPLLRRLWVPNAGILIKDLDKAKCFADRKPLILASRDGCWGIRAVIWGTVGAVVALIMTTAVMIVLKKNVRLRLKAYMLVRGLCVRWVKPDDNDDCKYDAFISFSHWDTDYAEELLQELESGPKRLKLCVHYRDWPPGIWIPAQIARSVAESRRTVILLSDNYIASSWARAEFREAYAKAILGTSVRLIVVLLGDKPPQGLDDELQHYVNNNTYVKWGEPAFWEKLRTALPESRYVAKQPRKPEKKRKQKTEPQKTKKAGLSPRTESQKHPKRRKSRKKKKKVPTSQTSNVNPNVREVPDIVVVPNSTDADAVPAPPTPIVKFTQIDFPDPVKPAKQETSPCA